MAQITNHAKKRAKERAGIGKKDLPRMASKIFREGVTHKECSGELKHWVTAKYYKYNKANNIRLYGRQCYIFSNDTLITVLEIPEHLVGEVARIRKERTAKEKYYLDKKDRIIINGLTLSRIVAKRDFADVHKGDIGGYIMNTKNLSHEGDCWIYDDACVYGGASVIENATVQNSASVDEHAMISGQAAILDSSVVRGNAVISDQVILTGNSRIQGCANVCGEGTISDLICDCGTYQLPIPGTDIHPQTPTDSQKGQEELRRLKEVGFCRTEQEAQLLQDWLRSH